jgi:glutaredoxin
VITIYSKNNCPFCVKAKNLLKLKGVSYEEIRIDEMSNVAHKEFIVAEGHRTVPQIYQDGKLLVEGGYTGLAKQSEEFFNQLKG